MRNVSWIVVLITVFGCGAVSSSFAEESTGVSDAKKNPAKKRAVAANERVWEGYLWKDDQGRIQIGWPVVSMGVIAMPAHVVRFPKGIDVTPFLAPATSSYVFWNYTLEAPFEKSLPKLPRTLIRIRGAVTSSPGQRDLTMNNPIVLSVEHVSEAWLKAWAPVFRTEWSPWRIRKSPAGDKIQGTRKAAPVIFSAFKAMHAVPKTSDAERKAITKAFPNASVVDTFRRSTELNIVRWLRDVATKHGVKLEGLDQFGPVPPTGVEIQRIFASAASRDAFVKALKKRWPGSVATVKMPYYAKNSRGGVTWAEVPLADVLAWSEEAFRGHQRLTQITLKR